MNIRLYISIAILFLVSNVAFAQPVSATKYETMIEVAEESADNNDYANAIEWYETAYKESKDINIKLAVGDLYMLLKNYQRAERSYNIVLRRDKNDEYLDVLLDYAEALKYQRKYKEALESLRTLAAVTEEEDLKEMALKEIKLIEGIESLPENIEIVVEYLDSEINSGSGENSPAFYPDENALYFSSFSRRSTINLDEDDDYHAAIYFAPRKDDGTYDEPLKLADHINRPDYHTSGVSFSADGKTMYFTRVLLDVNEIAESKIYRSFRKDNGWAAPNEIEALSGDFLAMHPFEGELYGNKVLFFTSDMEGGYGGTDIYYSTIQGDEFGIPTNIGEAINTSGDEITPFYQDGTLYFSSDFYPGAGGQDIFKADWNGTEFVDLVNMGDNYNSEVDDAYFRMDAGGKNGYLVSNRPDKKKRRFKGSETCCDDIYTMKLEDIIINLMATVTDEDEPLEDATVELFDMSSTEEGPVNTKTNLKDNNFNFLLQGNKEYMVIVTREGYLPDTTIRFNTVGILDDYTINKRVKLVKDPNYNKDGSGDEQTEEVAINQPIRLGNIYYDFDKWDILPDAEDDLSYLKSLMDQYPDMVIELSSHTDSKGVSSYNQTLSKKRAESAKAWLVSRGVSDDRIQAVGYGEEMILNRCTNGVRCSDEEHRLNRRTEFKIIAGPQTITIKKIQKKKTYEDDDHNGGKQSALDPTPVIKFVENYIDIGQLRKGDSKEVTFHFINAGDADLMIEMVSACKCTDLEWPKEAIKAGDMGKIKATFHTADQKIGELTKTLDIIANTEPIVVEAKFVAEILPPVKKM